MSVFWDNTKIWAINNKNNIASFTRLLILQWQKLLFNFSLFNLSRIAVNTLEIEHLIIDMVLITKYCPQS